jgi:conjugative transfer signal peptidase TraF
MFFVKYFISFLLALIIMSAAYLYFLGFRYNATESMPKGIYQILKSKEFKRGDMVAYCLEGSFTNLAYKRGYLHHGSCPNGLEPLLKRVVGLPGDAIHIFSDGISINHKLLLNSKISQFDSHGNVLTSNLASQFITIPAGMAFIFSDSHPGGFDSRYFGLVSLKSLKKVKAIFYW